MCRSASRASLLARTAALCLRACGLIQPVAIRPSSESTGTAAAAALTNTTATFEDAYVPPDVWIVSLGETALVENQVLAQALRRQGVKCGMELTSKSMKAQMRGAGKSQAPFVIIRGENEMEAGVAVLKTMEDGTQEELPVDDLLTRLMPS